MSTSPTSENPMNSGAGESDDLTRIKGIGPVRQQWLRETFNVRTYQDLAALSPEEIESQLLAERRNASRDDIERWLAQARELAAAAKQPVTPTEAATGTLVEEAVKRPRKAEAWRPLASFALEFREHISPDQPETYQTAVHHMEADADAVWPGIESKELCAWILEQVGDKVKSQRAESTPIETAPALVTPIPIAISQVCAIQPPNAKTPTVIGEPGRLIQGSIRSAEPFALEVAFQLAEPPTIPVAQQITYHAQFLVRSLAIGTKRNLGNTEPAMLAAGQTTYTARLSQTSLQPGTYRLQVLVSLQSRPPSVGYLEIPLLQVV